jgi:RNA polymerase sigma-70 factor (ECF subfamily)
MASATHVLGRISARRLGDAGLFEHAARGDAAAFSEVYRRYQKRVYGFCLARTGDPDAAADATQEVFLRLLRTDPGEIENPKAWLFAVARNVAIDSLRKRARLAETGAFEEDSPAWASLAAADTADEVLGRAEGDVVFLALRSLSARQRTALILREIHGQSSKDMAEALDSTPGAIDTLVSRSRDAFGTAYAVASGLPPACRAAVELVYREKGSGITEQERVSLDAHLVSCERCRVEAKKADDPRHLAALLPFLVPARGAGGILQRLALAGHPFSDALVQAGTTVSSQPHVWNLASKLAAGVLVAALVVAPVAGTVMRGRTGTTVHTQAASPAVASSPPASRPSMPAQGRAAHRPATAGTASAMGARRSTAGSQLAAPGSMTGAARPATMKGGASKPARSGAGTVPAPHPAPASGGSGAMGSGGSAGGTTPMTGRP